MRNFLDDAHRVARDQKFFVRRNRIGKQPGTVGRNQPFAADSFSIPRLIKGKPRPFHPRANPRPHIGGILSNPPGEHDRIGTAHRCQICADLFPRSIAEDLNRQSNAAIIMLFQFRLQFAHVVREAGNPEKSGLRVQKRVHFG